MRWALLLCAVALTFASSQQISIGGVEVSVSGIINSVKNFGGQVLGHILSYLTGKSGTQVVEGGLHLDYNIQRCKILGIGKKRFIKGIIDKIKPKCKASFTLRELGITGSAEESTQSKAVEVAMSRLESQLGALG